jgi:hypothetical protein
MVKAAVAVAANNSIIILLGIYSSPILTIIYSYNVLSKFK